MEIISFTGKSGTGKSYQANNVCMRFNIDSIIDDGLFIYRGRIAAGTSAKKCGSRAAAMRIALFDREDNRKAVKAAIERCAPDKILIIGTSDKMTDWIVRSLELPPIGRRLYVEDFTTPEEREEARYSRDVEGEHIIPAPMGQLKRDFAGYFMNPLMYLKDKALGKDLGLANYVEEGSSVVRPKFSYCGSFVIGEQVLRDIVDYVAEAFGDCLEVIGKIGNGKQGNLALTVDVRILKRDDVIESCGEFRQTIYNAIERMTSFSVNSVNIRIKEAVNDYDELHRKKAK